MSVSHRAHSGDVDANIGSPLKPSYEGSPSPDFNFNSSSSTISNGKTSNCESRSPSPPISFSSNFSQSINSPLLSSLTSSSSPFITTPASPYSTVELTAPKSFLRSRSLSPNYHPSSPSSLSLPSHRSIPPLSPNKTFSFMSSSSPLSPLKELPLRERCEALLMSRSLTKKNDSSHSNPPETFADSDPFMPFVHSNNADQENLKPGSSQLVPQPSYSKNRYISKISTSENKQLFVADNYCSSNDSSSSTSSLRERCEVLLKVKELKKNNRKLKNCNKLTTNEAPFSCSSSSSKETLNQVMPKSLFNSILMQPSQSLGKSSISYPYDYTKTSLPEDLSAFGNRGSTDTSCPFDLAPNSPLSPPPYHSKSFSPPYELSPSHSLISNQTAVSPYHDYPSVSISCASTLYSDSPDMMSVTVTTCSSTSSGDPNSNGLNLSIKPTKSTGQKISLYNPPLNPQDYQTSPPIYKSSTSFSDHNTLDFLSGALPSSSSATPIMYSYAPFSSRSLAAKISSSNKLSCKVNCSESQATFSTVGSQLQPSLNSQQKAALKKSNHTALLHKYSTNAFQLSIGLSDPNVSGGDSVTVRPLKACDGSVLQSSEISNSHQKESKSSKASIKLFPAESSSNSVCEGTSNALDRTASYSMSHAVDPNVVIKTDTSVAEIVDVEYQGPPCVVDLTCEDDDDVEIVSADQPVVFLGSESSSRRPSRRQRRAALSQSSSSSSEPIIVSDSPMDTAGDSPSNAISISDFPESVVSTSEGGSSRSGHTPQLFGDLFNQSVIPVDSDNEPRTGLPKSSRNLPSTSSQRTNHTAIAKKQLRRERDRDRSRSPLAGNDESDLDPVEAPIPPDVLDDIASLYAESHTQHRLPVSLYKKSIFSTASDILHKAAYGLSNICMFSAHDRPVPPQFSQPSTSSSDDSGGLSCPICFETFQDIKKAGRSLSSTVCGHIFCTNCLEAALKQTKLCPTCRKRLNKKQYHPLYI